LAVRPMRGRWAGRSSTRRFPGSPPRRTEPVSPGAPVLGERRLAGHLRRMAPVRSATDPANGGTLMARTYRPVCPSICTPKNVGLTCVPCGLLEHVNQEPAERLRLRSCECPCTESIKLAALVHDLVADPRSGPILATGDGKGVGWGFSFSRRYDDVVSGEGNWNQANTTPVKCLINPRGLLPEGRSIDDRTLHRGHARSGLTNSCRVSFSPVTRSGVRRCGIETGP
jgi:hypothetical protein